MQTNVFTLYKHYLLLLILMLLTHISIATAIAAQSVSIELSSGNEINTAVYPAQGDYVVLWFYSEAGPQPSDHQIARQLSSNGVEVWIPELFESYFLPVSLSNMQNMPANDISDYIQQVARRSNKTVIPVTTGRAAIPLLRARQITKSGDNAVESFWPGSILISPKFYIETPDPGTEASLMPITTRINSLLFVMQPQKSPWFWKLDETIPALEKSGSDVFIQPIADVRDRFYFRPDADTAEKQRATELPDYIHRAISALANFPLKARTQPLSEKIQTASSSKKERKLNPHKGSATPEALQLETLNGNTLDLASLRGKVVLVNFWASWCPPCVHEMPSMQRIQDQLGEEKFVILGVNMAEEKSDIEKFLKEKVAVTFPILLDKDGSALKRWKVFAFPTSYLIDKQGNIRYSLFGSIEWDQPDVIETMRSLINE